MATTYQNLLNVKRDLSDILSWKIAQKPNFIGRFFSVPTANGAIQPPIAYNTKYEWLESVMRPKLLAYSAYASGAFTVASSAGWEVGDIIAVDGEGKTLRITAVTDTTVSVAFFTEAGADEAVTAAFAPAATGVLRFISRPAKEGSNDGENMFSQSGKAYNFTQIFRKEVKMTGTALAVKSYGNENNIPLQVERAIEFIIRDMNSALVLGRKSERFVSGERIGTLGGLYEFGGKQNGTATTLSVDAINNGVLAILENGCEPSRIVCNPVQANKFANLMVERIDIEQADTQRGTTVTRLRTAFGNSLEIVYDDVIPQKDIWIVDPSGWNLVPLNGRGLKSVDSTDKAIDGQRISIYGEYTAEFKNAGESTYKLTVA